MSVAYLAAVALAAVFALAAVAKLADVQGARAALRGFGVPDSIAAAGSVALPVLELCIAIALLIPSGQRLGGVAASVLLAAFILAIVRSMRLGLAPDCHCFGQLHSAPVGWPTLIRNALLLGLAGLVLALGPDRVSIATPTTGEWVIAAIVLLVVGALAVQGWFLVQLLRQNGRILGRLRALEQQASVGARASLGKAAPAFDVADIRGGRLRLSDLPRAAQSTVLVFLNAGCAPCIALVPLIAQWQALEDRVRVVVLGSGDDHVLASHAAEHRLLDLGIDGAGEVGRRFDVKGTPAALVIDANLRVASAVVYGENEIRRLFEWTVKAAPGPAAASADPGGPRALVAEVQA